MTEIHVQRTPYGEALDQAETATAAALAAIETAMLAHGDRDAGPEWSALHNAWESAREARYVAYVLANDGEFTETELGDIPEQARIWCDEFERTGDAALAFEAVGDRKRR